ncbi:MAG: glycerol-3-phosphate 1-O-acyltransferase PlsY [bacterium]|nr:glycerol-3-phosphate 1-O-acyltransferase PlsY [bacterium]
MDKTIMILAVMAGVISYLIGSVNFSIMLSRAVGGKDIRSSGSGNAGATNMMRTYGKKMGVITLLLDVAKGIIAILIVNLIVKYYNDTSLNDAFLAELDRASLPYIAGLCVVLGHNFPLYFGFKGGKGVATSLGVVLMLDWKLGLIIAVCAVAVMAITRYVSFGSILGGAAFIVGEAIRMVVAQDFIPVKLVCCVLIGGMLIVRHHANIKRLLNGTENKLGAKKN